MQAEAVYPHRGISMHRLAVAGDFPGLIFTLGAILIFLLAIPALWYVLVAAVAVGLVLAAVLGWIHERPIEATTLELKIWQDRTRPEMLS